MSFANPSGGAGLMAIALVSAPAMSAEAPAPAEVVAKGAAIYDEVCNACHYAKVMDPLVAAPPIFAVQHHYADYSDRESFVAAVSAYVLSPSKEGALMVGAIDQFGVMPMLGLSEAEARAVAEYLFVTDYDLPDWYVEHYRMQYGAGGAAE